MGISLRKRHAPHLLARGRPHKRICTDQLFQHSDINSLIMDYLVSEGYPGAAEKFAQETNICTPGNVESIRERVRVRGAIQAGKVDEAIERINDIDSEVRSRGIFYFLLR